MYDVDQRIETLFQSLEEYRRLRMSLECIERTMHHYEQQNIDMPKPFTDMLIVLRATIMNLSQKDIATTRDEATFLLFTAIPEEILDALPLIGGDEVMVVRNAISSLAYNMPNRVLYYCRIIDKDIQRWQLNRLLNASEECLL